MQKLWYNIGILAADRKSSHCCDSHGSAWHYMRREIVWIYTHSGLWVSLSMCVKFSLRSTACCFPLMQAHRSNPTACWAFIIMTLFIYTALNLPPLVNTPSSSSAHFKHLCTRSRTVIKAGAAGCALIRIQRCSVVWASKNGSGDRNFRQQILNLPWHSVTFK